MRHSFHTITPVLVLAALLSGAAFWVSRPDPAAAVALARSPMDSAIPIHAEDDDPCKPDFSVGVHGTRTTATWRR